MKLKSYQSKPHVLFILHSRCTTCETENHLPHNLTEMPDLSIELKPTLEIRGKFWKLHIIKVVNFVNDRKQQRRRNSRFPIHRQWQFNFQGHCLSSLTMIRSNPWGHKPVIIKLNLKQKTGIQPLPLEHDMLFVSYSILGKCFISYNWQWAFSHYSINHINWSSEWSEWVSLV